MSNFRNKALHGIAWTTVATIGKQAIKVVGMLFLARLLSPEEFGLLAMILVFTGFSQIIMNFGFGQALIQKEEVNDLDWSSVFWFNTILSGILTFLLFISAPLIAQFYDEKLLISITRIISFTLLLGGLTIVHRTRFIKIIDFKTISKIDVIAALGGTLTGLGLALLDFGVWSLVWMQITIPLITCIGFWWVAKWKPSLKYSSTTIKDIFSFSVYLFGQNCLNYIAQNIDNLIVGRYIGSTELGFYSKGYYFMLMPINLISSQLRQVMFPSFSKIQHNKTRINSIFLLINQAIALIIFPILALNVLIAEELVYYILGEKWMGMVIYLKIFSCVGIFASINSFRSSVLLAQGHSKSNFKIGVIAKFFTLPLMCVGIIWGGVGVAMGRLIGIFLSFIPILYIQGKIIDLSVTSQLKIFQPILLSLIIPILLILVTKFLNSGILPLYTIIPISFLSLSIYLYTCHLLKVKAFLDLKSIIIKKISKTHGI